MADEGEREGEGRLLHEAGTDAIAQMPGYDKLVRDQLDVLDPLTDSEERVGGFQDRAEYQEWTLRIFAVGLGRRPELGAVVMDERVVPFLIASERGDTPAGRELRRRLHRRIVWEFLAPAQSRFAEKAREQPKIERVYLREAKQKSDWDAVAGEP